MKQKLCNNGSQADDDRMEVVTVIWSGREAIHASTPDTFSTNAALRHWIGLPPIQT